MKKPIVAVVGRPNVGKSTLFNKIVGSRISIVEDTPGVTRDRIYAESEWNGIPFILIDTGGIEPDSKDIILSQMREQARIAIETADVILFLVDGRAGLTAADREVGDMLMRTGRNVILVVNKIDTPKLPDSFYDFYELGLGEPVPVSAANVLNLGDLLDLIVAEFPKEEEEQEEDDTIKIAVIGKPNVGKSSLINAMIGEERVIVSDIAGTTRDSIDTPFEHEGQKYTLIDTAGIRRRKKVTEDIERFSVIRAITSIERSDVCIVMIDASEGVTEQDKKIAGLAHEAGKGIILTVNKWDLIEKDTHTMGKFERMIRSELSFVPYAPILFISAATGQRVPRLFEMINYVHNQSCMRISTGMLNNILADAQTRVQPPTDRGRRLKIYYMTQVGVCPPHFVVFCNERKLFHFSYQRYLENCIRNVFGLEGTPVIMSIREKGDKEE